MSKIKQADCYCICYSCDERLNIGDSIQYETSGYTAYCDNTECTEGIATRGTCLEYCWFGEDEDIEWEEKESEVVCDACDGKGYLTDVYDTEAGETQTQRCDSCQLFESDKQAQSHIEWLLTRKVRMINKDDIIVTKDELYLQQAPSLNFELDADELLEKALLRGFVEKVGDDKYKINNDYSGSQE
jgi:hypothetical protein